MLRTHFSTDCTTLLYKKQDNFSNDFIKINGGTVVQPLPQVGAAGKIDNEFDVDWFALNIAEAGTKKTFTLNGTSYAKSNFRMIVLDKNLNYVERSSTNILLISSGEISTSYKFLTCSAISRWLIPQA